MESGEREKLLLYATYLYGYKSHFTRLILKIKSLKLSQKNANNHFR
jgi:hypothetical protein